MPKSTRKTANRTPKTPRRSDVCPFCGREHEAKNRSRFRVRRDQICPECAEALRAVTTQLREHLAGWTGYDWWQQLQRFTLTRAPKMPHSDLRYECPLCGDRNTIGLGYTEHSLTWHLAGRGRVGQCPVIDVMLLEMQAEREPPELPTFVPRPHGDPTPEYVYLMRDTGTGFVKIGRSVNPVRRIQEIQTSSPVEMLAMCKGGLLLERALHREFAEQRHHGEWFRPTPAIFESFGLSTNGESSDA